MRPWLAALGCLLVVSGSGDALAARPHIVLVMADDQGWGDMAYNGHPTLKTPHFDQAAKTGLRFDRFYAAAPVCSPTRASVMTGRHPNRMGVFKWGYPLRPQETTLAEALKSAGYRTGHFGKWHLGSVRPGSPAHPGNHGFDEWLSAPNFYDNDPVLSHRGRAVPTPGESSMVIVDAALEWMKGELAGGAPLLIVVWFGSPHGPHQAAEQDRALYPEQPSKLQNFYGEISGMDRAFGKLRQGLTSLGIRRDTLLWYCSDNGGLPKVGSTGGHRANKGSVYEGGLLVPAILEWPAVINTPRSTRFRANTSDIYPTLLDLVGVTVPHQAPLDGMSLLPLVRGGEFVGKRAIGFWDYAAPGIGTPSAKWMAELFAAQRAGQELLPHVSSLRAATLPSPPIAQSAFSGHAAWLDGDFKLHRIQKKKNRQVTWELYNLAEDPQEKHNLAEKHPDRVRAMRASFDAWIASVIDSLNGTDY